MSKALIRKMPMVVMMMVMIVMMMLILTMMMKETMENVERAER